ncbi:hypothetical protein Q8F55_005208 [Vanrija albida]|uniref:Uncharacterized protein n=1 Tax=Vanrija albida TaxID=181172 RepID=A0ABR3Q143_9TREE
MSTSPEPIPLVRLLNETMEAFKKEIDDKSVHLDRFKEAAMQTMKTSRYTDCARAGQPQYVLDHDLVSSLVHRIRETLQEVPYQEIVNSVLHLLFQTLLFGQAVHTPGRVQLWVESRINTIRAMPPVVNNPQLQAVISSVHDDLVGIDYCLLFMARFPDDIPAQEPDARFLVHLIDVQKGICRAPGCQKPLVFESDKKHTLSFRRVCGRKVINLGRGIPAFDVFPAVCSFSRYPYSLNITDILARHVEVAHAECC